MLNHVNPQDLNDLKRILGRMDIPIPQEQQADDDTCPCPFCRLRREELPPISANPDQTLTKHLNYLYAQIPLVGSMKHISIVVQSVLVTFFVAYALGVDNARKEEDHG